MSGSDSEEPVRTLFLSGLPLDVKSREVHNLLRPFPNYISSTLSSAGERKLPVAFGLFKDQSSALVARDALQGMNFDPETSVTLRIELAKSNSKSRRHDRPRAPRSPGGNYAPRVDAQSHTLYSHDMMGNNGGGEYSMFSGGYPPQGERGSPHHGGGGYHGGYSPSRGSPHHGGYSRQPSPCPTLFIGNLPPAMTDGQIDAMFNQFTGFERIKISRRNDHITAFVDFCSTSYSTRAMQALQSQTLPADSALAGLRIEFARNRMGGQQPAAAGQQPPATGQQPAIPYAEAPLQEQPEGADPAVDDIAD